MLVVFCLLALPACAQGTLNTAEESIADPVAPACTLDGAQHPFRGAKPTPGGRGFLASGNHLGWDLMAPEGLPIYSIGCGVVRLVRAANGYGTLAVVIEHRLPEPTLMTNGRGSRVLVSTFLSIYGHLRPTSERSGRGVSTGLRVGDSVSPETVIGYIEHRAQNGDGDEHLHFGVRLQSVSAAQRSDPTAWFRGYDTTPTQRGWFADPERALRELAGISQKHPPVPRVMDAGVRIDERPLFDAGPVVIVDAPTVHVSTPDVPAPMDGPAPSTRLRYEFRVRSTLRVTPPFHLRDHWWRMVPCENTGSTSAELVNGWARCDAERVELFDGSFFAPDHPDWGDQGQIGTVANAPNRCTPVTGAEWRITRLQDQHVLFEGPVSGLPCRAVGSQDRLGLPE